MIRYRHLIWDWNGTLLDDVHTCVEVLNLLCRQYQVSPTTYSHYRQEFDFPVERFYQILGFDFNRESYQQVAEDYIELYTQRQRACPLHAHTQTTLETCRTLGLDQSILSAYHQSLLQEIVLHFGIADYFDHIAGLSDLHAKSKVEVGRELLKRIDCQPSQILLIGDTTHDYEVAQALGTDCVLIHNGHQAAERLHACGTPVLEGLNQIPDWVTRVIEHPIA